MRQVHHHQFQGCQRCSIRPNRFASNRKDDSSGLYLNKSTAGIHAAYDPGAAAMWFHCIDFQRNDLSSKRLNADSVLCLLVLIHLQIIENSVVRT